MLNLFKAFFSSRNQSERATVARTLSEGLSAPVETIGQSATPMQRGNAFLAQGEFANAAICYQEAIEVNPKYAEAHLNLGFVLKEQGLFEKASHALKQAIQFNPSLEDAYYLLATIFLQLGRLDEAIDNYKKAIEHKPDFEMAYRDLSQSLLMNGQTEQAITTLLTAISLFPVAVDFPLNLGKIYIRIGHFDKAIECFLKTLAIQSDLAEAHFNLGVALQVQDKLDAAVNSFQSAIAIEPGHVEAHANLGVVLQKQGKLDAAISSYRSALTLHPDLAVVQNRLACVLQAQGKPDEAIRHLQQAVAINPNYAEARNNLGVLFEIQGSFEASVESYQTAISIDPDYSEAHSNLANALRALGAYDEAIASCHRALVLNPDLAEAHFVLGIINQAMKQPEAAIVQFQIAITLKPDYVNAHYNLGAIFLDLCDWKQAILCFDKTISLNPDFAQAHLNMSCCQLLLGNFETGWAEYEWRWQCAHMKPFKYNFKQPLWQGIEPLPGKIILLHHEQGFGDTLQFCRYAKLVAELGAKVLLIVPPTLKLLLTRLEGVDQVLTNGELLPAFDYHCPLMSLPLALSTRLNNIPAESHYIQPDLAYITKWLNKLGNKTRPRVGLVWCGNKDHQHDSTRSISLAKLLPYMPEQVQLISLQKELRPIDHASLSENKDITHFGEELKNFMDTAGLIANMDLVISVDTSIAHLAGAMGKPVWILLPFSPDWRWMLERKDCPWYPSAKLFRQPKKGDWDRVFSELSIALQHAFPRLM